MPVQGHLLAAVAFSRMERNPTRLHTMIQDEVVQGIGETINEVEEAQAEVQKALGLLRLTRRWIDDRKAYDEDMSWATVAELGDIEDRLAAAIRRLHELLGSLGKEMD